MESGVEEELEEENVGEEELEKESEGEEGLEEESEGDEAERAWQDEERERAARGSE